MSSPIKFRCWDKYTKKFRSPENYAITGEGELLSKNSDDYFHFNWEDRIITQQFTGYCDINGKEIYEGDICNYYHLNSLCYENKSNPVQVFWDNGRVYLVFPSTYPICHESDHANMEIIGNIFENADLLNQKED